MMFWKVAVFQSSGKEVPNMMDPLDWATLSHWTPQISRLVKKCTWKQN